MSVTTVTETAVADGRFRATLQDILAGHFGVDRPILRVNRRLAPYPSTFHLEEVDVDFAGGHSLSLMLKDLGSPVPQARGVKPTFLDRPEREIETYRAVLAAERFGTPIYYGTPDDRERPWLFLERVAGTRLRELGDFELWKRAAQWLADLHAEYATVTGRLERHGHLLVYDRDYFALWINRAVAISADLSEAAAELRLLAERYNDVAATLASLPRTLVHGEFYPSNILIRQTPQGPRVCAVDWEMAGLGPGVVDVAALAAGWSDAQARALAAEYYAAQDMALGYASFETFLTAFDCAQLHLAIQWLGWSSHWSPPPEHVHNWLDTALTLAGRLHLL